MKRGIISIAAVVLLLAFAGMAKANIVELNLFDLGCPTEFNWDNSYWQTDFNLGVAFTEISHVYINWSGEIMAGLVIEYDPRTLEPIGEPFPDDVGIGACLESPLSWRHTRVVSAGRATYPE